MAAFEGGLFAALTMAFGIAPGRRWMPQTVDLKVVPNVRIEPVLDLSDVVPDVSDARPDLPDEDDTACWASREMRLIASLPDMTGHDLSGLMSAVTSSGLKARDDVIDLIGSMGIKRYADACWLENIYRNSGRMIYAEPSRSEPTATKSASTRAFVKWWRARPAAAHEVSQADLIKLYAEYCEIENVLPLSDRQLVNKIKTAGVESFRRPAKIVNGKHHRPTCYRIRAKRIRA